MLSRRRLVLTALFALGGFLVVANSGTFVVSDPSVAPIPEALPGKGETGMDGGIVAPGIVDTNGVAPDQRSIIRRADLSLTVEAVEAAIDQATAAVLALGGEVSSSSIGGWIEPMPMRSDRRSCARAANDRRDHRVQHRQRRCQRDGH